MEAKIPASSHTWEAEEDWPGGPAIQTTEHRAGSQDLSHCTRRSFPFASIPAPKMVLQRLCEPACCAGLELRLATGSWEQPRKDILLHEQGTSWVFPLVLLALPTAILLHEGSGLFIALIDQVQDQRVIGKSSTVTSPWLESQHGFITLSGFPRKWVQPLDRSDTLSLSTLGCFQSIMMPQPPHPCAAGTPAERGLEMEVPTHQHC